MRQISKSVLIPYFVTQYSQTVIIHLLPIPHWSIVLWCSTREIQYRSFCLIQDTVWILLGIKSSFSISFFSWTLNWKGRSRCSVYCVGVESVWWLHQLSEVLWPVMVIWTLGEPRTRANRLQTVETGHLDDSMMKIHNASVYWLEDNWWGDEVPHVFCYFLQNAIVNYLSYFWTNF